MKRPSAGRMLTGRIPAGRMLAARIALALAALCLPAGTAVSLDVPFLSGRVVDRASMLGGAASADIEQRLKAYEDSTGNQIAVLIIPSLDGESLEEYALRVAETWKLGRKGVDNGALLLIARDDRALRIEVGYGLEASLTDAVTSYIIREIITPRFKAGDYEGGVRAGIDAMIAAADGRLDTSAPSRSDSGSAVATIGFFLIWYGIILVFTFLVVFGSGCGTWMIYAFLVPFYAGGAAVLSETALPWIGWGILILYLLGVPVLKLLLPKTAWGKKLQSSMAATSKGARGRSSGGWWMSGSSSGGGFSGGGGGFSGGGGSFGGGGSSGSW